MRVVGLEEHYVTAEVVKAWTNLDPRWQDPVVAATAGIRQRLLEIGDQRLAAMDDAGIDVQVASLTSPGLWNLAPAEARALQTDCNDQLAAAVSSPPRSPAGVRHAGRSRSSGSGRRTRAGQ